MFERFTKDARAVVVDALGHAERAGARTVGEEHLLLALFDREGSRASFALAALGADRRRDSVERALDDARRRGGLSRADSEALAGFGIDVDELVTRVEDGHGAGALASAGRRAGGRRGWFGRVPFAPESKDVLTRSLRIALGRREREIGDHHVLLAVTSRSGVGAEVLADHGVERLALERVLYGTAA
ncbi:peptidase [Streptomyces sp. SID4919]|uniref:Clp protease N-terminal domain-containing protein n=1 Tax=Streptomyces TaxID=1883 RepID=UPI0008237E5E|nr:MULTISPECIES: Clp protease N-terminal domain-containing protein [Streptomyces]MCX4660149.1 peptidase [Streptomyces uncialis]MYY12718.1 peptidase [Streptomyces sp. SID4919]SCK20837.1 Clp amino terminal domain-containing protein, pathogenicity island component [Streptomyces sp. AmelKG-E11A]